MLIFSILGACALVASSCVPARFTMQDVFAYPVRAVVLTRPNTIKRTFDNGFELTGPSRVALRAERVTHGQFSTEIIRYSDSPLIVQTRTTPHDDSVMHQRGLSITIVGDSTIVESDGQRSVFPTLAPIGKPFIVEVKNLGRTSQLRVHHTECGTFISRLPCTEWIIMSIPDTSRIFVGDPLFSTTI